MDTARLYTYEPTQLWKMKPMNWADSNDRQGVFGLSN